MAKSPVPVITPSPWLTIAEAAEYLRVVPLTIRNMVADGRLKAHYLGAQVVRLHIDEINAAMGRKTIHQRAAR